MLLVTFSFIIFFNKKHHTYYCHRCAVFTLAVVYLQIYKKSNYIVQMCRRNLKIIVNEGGNEYNRVKQQKKNATKKKPGEKHPKCFSFFGIKIYLLII